MVAFKVATVFILALIGSFIGLMMLYALAAVIGAIGFLVLFFVGHAVIPVIPAITYGQGFLLSLGLSTIPAGLQAISIAGIATAELGLK